MRVVIRNPDKELTIKGPISVTKLLNQLSINRESVLVIVDGSLVPTDATLDDESTVEIRSVISGGQARASDAEVEDPEVGE